jgi:low affinity Fe/Cu permease
MGLQGGPAERNPSSAVATKDNGAARMDKFFAKFANATAHAAGKPITFLLCVAMVLAWAVTGPMFGFSETWQLVINTGTTIITFLMVFLIQNTQNRDGLALQTKLDELIRATRSAHNEFIGIEKLTDKELAELQAHCEETAQKAAKLAEHAKHERHKRGGGAEQTKPAAAVAKRAPRSRTATPAKKVSTKA